MSPPGEPTPFGPWEIAGEDGCFFVLSHAVQSLVLEQDTRPGLADVTLYAYPPEYGTKQLVPPPAPEQLYWPTTWGPNAEGEISGALLPPALVDGVPVAGSRFRLLPSDTSSTVAVGILPFKEGG